MNLFEYKAFPTIAPSTPSETRDFSLTKSSNCEIPPEAISGFFVNFEKVQKTGKDKSV